MDKILINSDALNIVTRLKSLNSGYRLYYNLKNKKYMLYLFENQFKPMAYLLTFPFNSIDERMIDYTLKSEIQNRELVLKEIEESNSRLLKNEHKKLIEQMENLSDGKRNY